MSVKHLFAAVALIGLSAPAHADDGATHPASSCGTLSGTPCPTTGGGTGPQGGANRAPASEAPAPALTITRPTVRDRGVFVSQVGTGNVATITQSAADARAGVIQDGDHHRMTIDQAGTAASYAATSQTGVGNYGTIEQGGRGGGNATYLYQDGAANGATVSQYADNGENGAIVVQSGIGNGLSLTQSGADNLAQLEQHGDGNQMSASQSGGNNRLLWTQQGNNLSNLVISQSGNQSLQITQSR